MKSTTIDYKDREITVFFDYTPAEPMIWTYANGDPGHPGAPAEINIYGVFLGERKITAWLSEDDFLMIANTII
jgi:hypothetical protein